MTCNWTNSGINTANKHVRVYIYMSQSGFRQDHFHQTGPFLESVISMFFLHFFPGAGFYVAFLKAVMDYNRDLVALGP